MFLLGPHPNCCPDIDGSKTSVGIQEFVAFGRT